MRLTRLVALLLVVASTAVASAATPAGATYVGKASALIEPGEPVSGIPYVGQSTSPLTTGPRTGLRSSAGADYAAAEPCPLACAAVKLRVLVFKSSAAALAHWKGSCPGCSPRKAMGGWPYKVAGSFAQIDMVALCKNLVVAVQGVHFGGDARYAKTVAQNVFDSAASLGMKSCDPLKQEPTSDVFARGSAEGRGKAVAVGSVKAPSHVFLRVRSSGFGRLYVEWTLTCTNGKRTETTHDEGLATLPLLVELPIGLVGATRCSATAAAYSTAPANYSVEGTHVVELFSRT